jgi:hypothetical protein
MLHSVRIAAAAVALAISFFYSGYFPRGQVKNLADLIASVYKLQHPAVGRQRRSRFILNFDNHSSHPPVSFPINFRYYARFG